MPSPSVPQLIFANMVNELMLPVPGPRHGRSLVAVSPRKIWLAYEGDLVVTPRPIDPAFKRYACGLTGVDPNRVLTLSLESDQLEPLATTFARMGKLDRLRTLIAERPGIELNPFALDRPTLELAEQLGLGLQGYSRLPDAALRTAIYRLNTKSGFRQTAEELGMRTVPGISCEGIDAAVEAVHTLMGQGAGLGAIVKFDRSSNGYGHTFVRTGDLKTVNLHTYLRESLNQFPEQPHVFTVEALMPFVSVPSIEMEVVETGVNLLYPCDQRCPNGSFSGMIVPPLELPSSISEELLRIGYAFGEYLHRIGFRGAYDVDTGLLEDGSLFVTETNLRHTGGTYLDLLVRRLVGENYLETSVWWADSRLARQQFDFEACLNYLNDQELAFDHMRGDGVILTADTLAIDGKLRYMVIAPSAVRAAELESRLEALLQS